MLKTAGKKATLHYEASFTEEMKKTLSIALTSLILFYACSKNKSTVGENPETRGQSGDKTGRGAARSRTGDGGFAIHCLSLLATAP